MGSPSSSTMDCQRDWMRPFAALNTLSRLCGILHAVISHTGARLALDVVLVPNVVGCRVRLPTA